MSAPVLEFICPIDGYEGYEVTNKGRVYSHKTDCWLKPGTDRDGYLRVCLCKNGKGKTMTIHRLVARHFLADYNSEDDVDHINWDKTDNSEGNLRMMHPSKNNSRQNKAGRSSRYHGVCWHKATGKWIAQIQTNGKVKHLGCFDNEKSAAITRDQYISDNNLEDQYQLNDSE